MSDNADNCAARVRYRRLADARRCAYLRLSADAMRLRSVAGVSVGLLEKRLPISCVLVWLENEERPTETSPWCGSREVRARTIRK